MTLTELSNIFNQVAQAIPEINNYHFGLLSDVNIPIINNWNPSVACQKKYPMLMLTPPDGSYSPSSGIAGRTLEIWVFDRQDSNGSGTTCDTLVEKFSLVEQIGNDFLKSLKFAKNKTGNPCLTLSFKENEAATILDGYQFEDNVVAYKMTIEVKTPYNANCVNVEYTDVNEKDEELYTCPVDGNSVLKFTQTAELPPTLFFAEFKTVSSPNAGSKTIKLTVISTGGGSAIDTPPELILTYLKTEDGQDIYRLDDISFVSAPAANYTFKVESIGGELVCNSFETTIEIFAIIP